VELSWFWSACERLRLGPGNQKENLMLFDGIRRGEGGLISLWLYKENNKLLDGKKKCIYIFPLQGQSKMS
jgi:hypothetical protein